MGEMDNRGTQQRDLTEPQKEILRSPKSALDSAFDLCEIGAP